MANGEMTQEQRVAFDAWWSELTKQGDPLHIPNKFAIAFKAGWKAAMNQTAQDFAEAANGAAIERMWQERQGEDYGSY